MHIGEKFPIWGENLAIVATNRFSIGGRLRIAPTGARRAAVLLKSHTAPARKGS